MSTVVSNLFLKSINLVLTSCLFPRDSDDYFKLHGSNFVSFFNENKLNINSEYYQEFASCEAYEFKKSGQHVITTRLASTGKIVGIDVVNIKPDADYLRANNILPGIGKHIVYFSGARDSYDTNGSLKDMALLAKATGATIYGFNYPGIHRSATNVKSIKVNEFHDMVNSGIAVVNHLIRIHEIYADNIILLGDSFGGAAASKVQAVFNSYGIKLRLIASNTFSSFKKVVHESVKSIPVVGWLIPNSLISVSLAQIGWDAELESCFSIFSPYNYFLQRQGDKTLFGATLSSYLYNYSLPEALSADYSRLLKKSQLKLEPIQQQRLLSSKSVKTIDDIDTHPFPLHFFTGALDAVKDFISVSNGYIALNPQEPLRPLILPDFLDTASKTGNRLVI